MCGYVLAGLLTVGLPGCGGDTTEPVPPSNPALLWSLAFQWKAVNLALNTPYDTAQVVAVPCTASGAILTDSAGAPYVVQYTTTDSAISVSTTGLITAQSVTSRARVVAQLTVGGITLRDTVFVQVTADPLPAPLATLSIHPQPDGLLSARTSNDNVEETIVPFFATIATGNPATDTICTALNGCTYPLLVRYASSDPTIASIDQFGYVTPHRAGRVIFSVSTVAYGVQKVDSLPFSIGYSAGQLIRVWMDSSQHPAALATSWDSLATQGRPHVTLGVGFRAFIVNRMAQRLEITLPTPSHGVAFLNPNDLTPLPQRVDTLEDCSQSGCFSSVIVRFDSAGTYTLHLRGLSTGQELTETFTLLPDP